MDFSVLVMCVVRECLLVIDAQPTAENCAYDCVYGHCLSSRVKIYYTEEDEAEKKTLLENAHTNTAASLLLAYIQ